MLKTHHQNLNINTHMHLMFAQAPCEIDNFLKEVLSGQDKYCKIIISMRLR